jgi:hypothetical protein
MDYVFIALAGWVGGGWAVTLGTAPRGYPNDDGYPWPPWPPCIACGGLAGLIAAIIFLALLPRIAASSGVGQLHTSFGSIDQAVMGLVVGAAAGLAVRAGTALLRGRR